MSAASYWSHRASRARQARSASSSMAWARSRAAASMSSHTCCCRPDSRWMFSRYWAAAFSAASNTPLSISEASARVPALSMAISRFSSRAWASASRASSSSARRVCSISSSSSSPRLRCRRSLSFIGRPLPMTSDSAGEQGRHRARLSIRATLQYTTHERKSPHPNAKTGKRNLTAPCPGAGSGRTPDPRSRTGRSRWAAPSAG